MPITNTIMAVVRAVNSGRPFSFRATREIKAIIGACDIGLCRLVPAGECPAVLVDEPHNNQRVGIELTAHGKEELKKFASRSGRNISEARS